MSARGRRSWPQRLSRRDHGIPANHLLSTDDAQHTDDRLLDSLQQWRNADTAPDPGLRALDANRATIDQAKGVVVLRYGIDPYQAFALMVRWSRVTHTPVHTIAHALVHDTCEGSPQTQIRQRSLIRWLEAQLRHDDHDLPQLPTAPVWRRTGT